MEKRRILKKGLEGKIIFKVGLVGKMIKLDDLDVKRIRDDLVVIIL